MLLILTFSLLGQMDDHTSKALEQTMQLLTNMGELRQEAAKTPQGQASMSQLDRLGGSEAQNEAIMKLAAEVFQKMVKDSNGDIGKLQEKMKEAQKNPERFAESWSSSEKQALKEIARGLPSN